MLGLLWLLHWLIGDLLSHLLLLLRSDECTHDLINEVPKSYNFNNIHYYHMTLNDWW